MALPARARLAAAVLAAAVVTATPALASAASYTHTDAARDVRTGQIDSDGPGRIDRREASVDIRRITVEHGTTNLVIKVTTRAPLAKRNRYVGATIRVPGGGTYEADHLRMFGVTHASLAGPEGEIDCAGLRARVDRARRLATLTVPTTCLGDPAWVRVGVGAARFDRDRIWIDDALRHRKVRDDLALSPRIARG